MVFALPVRERDNVIASIKRGESPEFSLREKVAKDPDMWTNCPESRDSVNYVDGLEHATREDLLSIVEELLKERAAL